MSVAAPALEPSAGILPAASQTGKLRENDLVNASRHFAVAIHLSPMVLSLAGAFPFSLLAPLVLWLVRRNEHPFEDDHGREVLNFCLSFLLWHFVTLVTVVGVVLWPVLWLVMLINSIRGAIAAGNSEPSP